MIDLFLVTALSCSESQKIMENLRASRMENRDEIIEVLKTNTEEGCYERSKHDT